MAAVAALVAGTAAARPDAAAAPLQHVTLIGDSVATALPDDPQAVKGLSQGIDLDLEVAPCRRVGDDSCPYNGVRPPNVIQLVKSMGSKLGPTVIVVVGYNDFADEWAANLEDALTAMKAAGVDHVVWATLRAAQHQYLDMNDELAAAAARHPELTVVDWNVSSRNHPEWFQSDGIHLLPAGAEGMAALLHQTLVDLGIAATPSKPPPPQPSSPLRIATRLLPVALRGKRYTAHLRAAGGRPPYYWSFPTRPPKGLHVRPTGWIFGTPAARPGTRAFAVRVADSSGESAKTTLRLRIRR